MLKTIVGSVVGVLLLNSAAFGACTVPNIFSNGTTADANQVNGNFTSIANCAAPLASPSFTGNVGIGTASASNLLTVASSYAPQIQLDTSSATNKRVGILFSSSGIGQYSMGVDFNVSNSQNFFVYDSIANAQRLVVLSSGDVGIGTTTPSYLLTVNGTAYASGAAGALSDIRHKKDVAALGDGALDEVMHLKPVTFFWKDPKDDGMRGQQMGFIAQDVEKVLPSVVLTQNDADKTKGLKYNEFIAVLTKAIQEQEAAIRDLKTKNGSQSAEIQSLKAHMAAIEHKVGIQTAQRE